ncbi:hypothetical protein CMEL01_06302 [Colletotrichum melonis]|uniref:Uncharacterized protein n=1 Tax=Colletotrichum melonis TaxID=1209925 RepID=A0AAI9U7F4_9PEZI|nr:hypothetical protein CMEL01_06302 [Colletotrichum melonis]
MFTLSFADRHIMFQASPSQYPIDGQVREDSAHTGASISTTGVPRDFDVILTTVGAVCIEVASAEIAGLGGLGLALRDEESTAESNLSRMFHA